MRIYPLKAFLTLICFAGILALADFVPRFHDYRVMDWSSVGSVLDFVERKPSVSPVADEEQRLRPETDPFKQIAYPIVDPNNQLDSFFRTLHQAEGNQDAPPIRILHYGDSPTTADMITSDARVLLQKLFGDAGHGFVLVAKPWAWYSHSGVDLDDEGWQIDAVGQGTVHDGLFGLGGVTFRGDIGAVAHIRIRRGGHRLLEVAYLRQPEGGSFAVEADGVQLGVVDTRGEHQAAAFAPFPISPNNRRFTIRALGPVRLFGVQFERLTRGVIYHSLGVNGASVSVLARYFNEAHWREQLRHYRPDLVIINYGTNESVYPQFVDTASGRELREVVRRVRAAVPEAAILIMSPMDRGQKMTGGEIGTAPAIPRLVAIQERVSEDTGSAFFNTFAAMGGVGTMGRWYQAEPRLVGADFIHPMPAGARIVGGLLYQALLDGYNKYKLRIIRKQTVVAQQ